MDFKDYQDKSKNTRKISKKSKDEVISFFGLIGETGVLLSEYKKKLRDKGKYKGFDDAAKEELGDILWYLSNLASRFKLDLNDIAIENLKKTSQYWLKPKQKHALYDKSEKKNAKLPRQFKYKIISEDGKVTITDMKSGKPIGDPLNDNSHRNDGYRYHDVMHLVFMAKLGWSPVWRDLLRNKKIIQKRKHHKAEDSGRSQVIDEAIVLSAYAYGERRSFYKNINQIDQVLLKYIKSVTCGIEVKNVSSFTWNKTILKGFELWRTLKKNKRGIIEGDLNKRTIKYSKC